MSWWHSKQRDIKHYKVQRLKTSQCMSHLGECKNIRILGHIFTLFADSLRRRTILNTVYKKSGDMTLLMMLHLSKRGIHWDVLSLCTV